MKLNNIVNQSQQMALKGWFKLAHDARLGSKLPIPILLLVGGHTSGKSELARALNNMLDNDVVFNMVNDGYVGVFMDLAEQGKPIVLDNIMRYSNDLREHLASFAGGARTRSLSEKKDVVLLPIPVILTAMTNQFPVEFQTRCCIISLSTHQPVVDNSDGDLMTDLKELMKPFYPLPQQRTIHDFKRGLMVKHKLHDDVYIIHANYGDRATAVRTVDITNPNEWEIIG